MKEWRVQFVSGAFWNVRETHYGGPFMPQSKAFVDTWPVERFDIVVPGPAGAGAQTEKRSMGIWTINMANVEAVKGPLDE